MMPGKLITFEGIDGSGGTTHSALAATWLREQGLPTELTSEPSKSPMGLLLRQTLKDGTLHPATDALLFAADRVEHSQFIRGLLTQGYIVLSDRYLESSLVYQHSQGLPYEWILSINKYALQPDLNILLDLDPEIALKRKPGLEKFEKLDFLTKVRQTYLDRSHREPKRWTVINTTSSIEEVQNEVRAALKKLLKLP